MKLYENNGKKYITYDFIEKNQDETFSYRMKQLSKLGKVIYYMKLNDDLTIQDILNEYYSNNRDEHFDKYEVFNLLYGYYSGYFNNCKLLEIRMKDNLNHYFLFHKKNNEYYEVLELNKELYLLGLIQQRKFNMLINENIDEQLNLFAFKEIENICEENNIDYFVENDSYILPILKKYFGNKNV